ncbi:MAG: hypothetical protein HY898_14650 [Deltaproteobacteria bacterium]|nr:hypothetical protein [Deltaproteobacteria bacterium]
MAIIDCNVDAIIAKPDDIRATAAGHIDHEAWMQRGSPSTGGLVVPELRAHLLWFAEVAVPVVQSYVDAIVGKADDIGAPVAGHVDHEPRVAFGLPAACRSIATELIAHFPYRAEFALPVVARRVHPVIGEPNDVSASVPGEVDHESGMQVCPPPSCGLAPPELIANTVGTFERAVPTSSRDVHPVVCETDDIGASAACQVGHEAGLQICTPSTSTIAVAILEANSFRVVEGAVPTILGNIDAIVREPNDVVQAVADYVSHEPRMAIVSPTACCCAVAEAAADERCEAECAGSLVEGNEDASAAETDEVEATLASDVSRESDVLVDSPTA